MELEVAARNVCRGDDPGRGNAERLSNDYTMQRGRHDCLTMPNMPDHFRPWPSNVDDAYSGIVLDSNMLTIDVVRHDPNAIGRLDRVCEHKRKK